MSNDSSLPSDLPPLPAQPDLPPVSPSPGETQPTPAGDVAPPTPAEVVAPPRPRVRWVVPLVLFLTTCASTYFVGTPYLTLAWTDRLVYSVCLMTILVCHEAGHFIQARRYRVRASLPYFLPMPFTPIGTFGAVIVMDSRVKDRRALFDIGISGPLAGLVPTLIFCVLGLQFGWSQAGPTVPGGIEFGEPLVFKWVSRLTFGALPEGHDIIIGPMAYAGWVGLLVTALNLLPIGQLDGGHILYGLLRRRAQWVATAVLVGAVVGAAVFELYMWWLMLLLLILMGPKHPPTTNDNVRLGGVRFVLGWLTLAFLPLGFTPNPFPSLGEPTFEQPQEPQHERQQHEFQPLGHDEGTWVLQECPVPGAMPTLAWARRADFTRLERGQTRP